MGTGNEYNHEIKTGEIKLVKDRLNREKEMESEIKDLRKSVKYLENWQNRTYEEKFNNAIVMTLTVFSYLFFKFFIR